MTSSRLEKHWTLFEISVFIFSREQADRNTSTRPGTWQSVTTRPEPLDWTFSEKISSRKNTISRNQNNSIIFIKHYVICQVRMNVIMILFVICKTKLSQFIRDQSYGTFQCDILACFHIYATIFHIWITLNRLRMIIKYIWFLLFVINNSFQVVWRSSGYSVKTETFSFIEFLSYEGSVEIWTGWKEELSRPRLFMSSILQYQKCQIVDMKRLSRHQSASISTRTGDSPAREECWEVWHVDSLYQLHDRYTWLDGAMKLMDGTHEDTKQPRISSNFTMDEWLRNCSSLY